MAEQRLTGTGLLTPTPSGARTAESLDTVTVLRDDRQRVSGSRRLSGDDGSGARVTAYVRELLAGAERAWGSVPGAPLQSAVARVRETRRETRSGDHGDGAWASATVLARLETVAGPVLIGAGTVGRGSPAPRPPPDRRCRRCRRRIWRRIRPRTGGGVRCCWARRSPPSW